MRLLIQFFIALTPFIFSLSTSDPTLSIRFLYLSVFISLLVFLQFYRKEMFSVNLFKHKILSDKLELAFHKIKDEKKHRE